MDQSPVRGPYLPERPAVSRFDRYILAQFFSLCGLFALVLVGVLWVNQAVMLFNRMAGDGHALRLLLEMTALALPGLIVLALPISAFAAVTYVTNRLITESELVVMQAVGFSSFRLARPAVVFGLLITLAMAALVNLAAPAARAALSVREAAAARDVTTGLLRAGVFQFPAAGVTFFVHSVGDEGRLENILLVDDREAGQGRRLTYTAASGQLFVGDRAPGLVLRDGMVQSYAIEDRKLVVTRFVEMALPLDALAGVGALRRVPVAAVPTAQLFAPDADILAVTGKSRDALLAEAHLRIAQPFLALATSVLGFSVMLLGAFSRFGLARQIIGAVVLMVVMQMIATWAQSQVIRTAGLWPLFWAAPGFGIAVAGALLWRLQRPTLRIRPALAPGSGSASDPAEAAS